MNYSSLRWTNYAKKKGCTIEKMRLKTISAPNKPNAIEICGASQKQTVQFKSPPPKWCRLKDYHSSSSIAASSIPSSKWLSNYIKYPQISNPNFANQIEQSILLLSKLRNRYPKHTICWNFTRLTNFRILHSYLQTLQSNAQPTLSDRINIHLHNSWRKVQMWN